MNRLPDPLPSFQFRVALTSSAGGPMGGFSEVTGLGVESEVETFREGGVNTAEQELPGPTRHPSRVVLKRGVTTSPELWAWYLDILHGKITRRLVTIAIFSLDRAEQVTWTLRDACPVKWVGPTLNAGAPGVSVESVELTHRGIVLPSA